jgi:hypothetical protein
MPLIVPQHATPSLQREFENVYGELLALRRALSAISTTGQSRVLVGTVGHELGSNNPDNLNLVTLGKLPARHIVVASFRHNTEAWVGVASGDTITIGVDAEDLITAYSGITKNPDIDTTMLFGHLLSGGDGDNVNAMTRSIAGVTLTGSLLGVVSDVPRTVVAGVFSTGSLTAGRATVGVEYYVLP